MPDAGAYVLSKEVRELCVFSPHSVIRDPPFSRIDLISCRNLLIYFGYDMQGQVIPTFHYALRPGGYLFLGTSENITQFRELFSAGGEEIPYLSQPRRCGARLSFAACRAWPSRHGNIGIGTTRGR